MSGAGKKRGEKITLKKKATNESSDNVTINDFANSASGPHGRLKKASTNVAASKGVGGRSDTELKIENLKLKETKSRRKIKTEESCEKENGIDYPLDLWFLISEYIEPEAVGKFASICQSSYHVVKTAKFWFDIYKRYYNKDAQLPARLRPDCMVRPYGLRACVIRALHLMYFLSRQHIGMNPYLRKEEPHSLVNRRCCLMWHKEGKLRWYVYFKLKEITNRRSTVVRMESHWDDEEKPGFSDMPKTVSANTEDGCRVLRVTCLKYGMVPQVMGLTLQTVRVTLSPGFDHHRVQLSFGTSYIPKTPTQVIVLNGVVDLEVLDWWHPRYPHHDVISSTILEATTESWEQVTSDYLTV